LILLLLIVIAYATTTNHVPEFVRKLYKKLVYGGENKYDLKVVKPE